MYISVYYGEVRATKNRVESRHNPKKIEAARQKDNFELKFCVAQRISFEQKTNRKTKVTTFSSTPFGSDSHHLVNCVSMTSSFK